MKIIYGYSNCTDKKYNELFLNKKAAVLQPDQKYHGLLIKGLAENGAKVQCFSGLPVNREVVAKLFLNEPDETEGNASFHYYRTINLPVFRQLMVFFGAFMNALFYKKEAGTCAIQDCLNVANAYGITLACKIKKIPVITIVTDLPDMLTNNKLHRVVNNGLFHMADGFILLTEQMNTRVNAKQKPYIVLEGHVDAHLPDVKASERIESLEGKKIIVYAGSIQKLYGIQNLVEGFLKADIKDTELVIFGDGDYKEELNELAKKHTNLNYRGICSNQEVVQLEQRAMLLVNPRPIAPEYTKYSFPSKNMEYMVSGTPVLTTKLPGMPKEYYPYVYLIEDESPEGIAKVLKEICNISQEEREKKGCLARQFVLEEKSNIVQAKKIIDFIKKKIG